MIGHVISNEESNILTELILQIELFDKEAYENQHTDTEAAWQLLLRVANTLAEVLDQDPPNFAE